jgi:hypothetical protein
MGKENICENRSFCDEATMKVLTSAALFFTFLAIANRCWSAPLETIIAGRPVSASLVKADDLSPAPWPDDGSKLTVETAAAAANANIYDLLTANGIEPDVEAFTIVYDLNPSLMQIDPLPSGVSLVLPKIAGGDMIQETLRHGFLVMLTVDSGLRQELAKNTSDLQDLSARFASLSSDRFASPPTRQEMVSNIRALAGWFAHVQRTFLQRTGPPLRRQTLLGIRDEVVALNSVLSDIVGGHQKITPDDQEQINAIYKDIQGQIKKYDNVMAGEPPVADGQYTVVVTIHGRDAEAIHGLQVYWTYQGLFRKPPKEPLSSQPFDGVGSGSSVNLTIADYVIWAGKPGHPFPPVTDQKPVSIGPIGGNPRQVGLTMGQ